MPINISGGAGTVYDATPSAFALSKMGADTAWRLSDANRESIRGLEQSISGTVRDVAGRIDRRQEAEKQRAQAQAMLDQQQAFQAQQATQAQQSVMAQAMESDRFKTQEQHAQRIQQGWDYSPDVKQELDQIERDDRRISADPFMSNAKKIEAMRLNNRKRAALVPNVRAKSAVDSFEEMKVGDEDENGVQRILQPRGDGSFELKELLGPKKRAAQIQQEAKAKQDDQVRNSLKDASQLIKDGMSRNDVAAMLEAQNDHGRFTSFINSLKSNSSGNGEFVEQEIPAQTLADWTELAAKATVDDAGSKRPLNAKEQQDMVQGLYKTYQGVLKARHDAARDAENVKAVGRLSASVPQPMLSGMQVVPQPGGMVAEGGPEMMGQIPASVPRETAPVESAPVAPSSVPVESVPRETPVAPAMTARPNLPKSEQLKQAAQAAILTGNPSAAGDTREAKEKVDSLIAKLPVPVQQSYNKRRKVVDDIYTYPAVARAMSKDSMGTKTIVDKMIAVQRKAMSELATTGRLDLVKQAEYDTALIEMRKMIDEIANRETGSGYTPPHQRVPGLPLGY